MDGSSQLSNNDGNCFASGVLNGSIRSDQFLENCVHVLLNLWKAQIMQMLKGFQCSL